MSNATTRDECLLLHVTPDQLQHWMEESFFHDGRSSALRSRWCLRHWMPSKSVVDSLWRYVFASNEGMTTVKREMRRIMANGRDTSREQTFDPRLKWALVPAFFTPGTRDTFSPGWWLQPGLKVPAQRLLRQAEVAETFSPGWSHQPKLKVY